MNNQRREAVIVAGTRTAVGKAKKGTTQNERSDEMAAAVIEHILRQTEGKLDPARIDDVILGCAMQEGQQGLNMARVVALRAGLPVDIPAQTVNRFCSSGLQTIASAAERIIADGADVIIAGGAETMSLVPMTGFRISPNPYMAENNPEVYMGMGLTAERVAQEWGVSREDQDEFAYNSHRKAAAAQDKRIFRDEITPVEIKEVTVGPDGKALETVVTFEVDEHLRRDTTIEGLAKLKPVFMEGGSVTAGNSSPLSDGAAALLVMERSLADPMGLKPLARFVGVRVTGVGPGVMGVS